MQKREFYWGPAKNSLKLSDPTIKILRLFFILVVILIMIIYLVRVDEIPINVTVRQDTMRSNVIISNKDYNNTAGPNLNSTGSSLLIVSRSNINNLNSNENVAFQSINNNFITSNYNKELSTERTSINKIKSNDSLEMQGMVNYGINSSNVDLSNSSNSDELLVKQTNFKSSYYVQCGVYSDKDTAEEEGKKLKDLGYNYLVLASDEDIEIYRLCVGPYKDANQANEVVKRLNAIGFTAFTYLEEQ